MINKDNIIINKNVKLKDCMSNDGYIYNDWRNRYMGQKGILIVYSYNSTKVAFFFNTQQHFLHTSEIKEIKETDKSIILYTLNSIYMFNKTNYENLELQDFVNNFEFEIY